MTTTTINVMPMSRLGSTALLLINMPGQQQSSQRRGKCRLWSPFWRHVERTDLANSVKIYAVKFGILLFVVTTLLFTQNYVAFRDCKSCFTYVVTQYELQKHVSELLLCIVSA
jgi:hypothetical protein